MPFPPLTACPVAPRDSVQGLGGYSLPLTAGAPGHTIVDRAVRRHNRDAGVSLSPRLRPTVPPIGNYRTINLLLCAYALCMFAAAAIFQGVWL